MFFGIRWTEFVYFFGSVCVVQAGLESMMVLPLPLECLGLKLHVCVISLVEGLWVVSRQCTCVLAHRISLGAVGIFLTSLPGHC